MDFLIGSREKLGFDSKMDDTHFSPITTPKALLDLKDELSPLVGHEIANLRIPVEAAQHFEPSQIGTIVGTLTDAMLPFIALNKKVGLIKGPGILGDREGYPDFHHHKGYRLELKGLFRDNPDVPLKKPPTEREPSARLTQKVTLKNVDAERDALLLLVYQLKRYSQDRDELVPVITQLAVFPVIECILARDQRLISGGGKWFGEYETPAILSKSGRLKLANSQPLRQDVYGRKESEGYDYNEDTNFGKLKRIPYKPLQEFLQSVGANFASRGEYPKPWVILSKATKDGPNLYSLSEADD